jgi:uncharacterized protein YpuA (DUF1002 family)
MKKKLLAALLSAVCVLSAVPSCIVLADGQKVVTLGADLSEEQKQAILRYFGVAGQTIETLTITNTDERNHLGAYVPLEQIGTKTFSCALVNPTNSGGIQVKTANLTWVTSNMIATTLSTSGVVNCEVLAAAPFEVSGTGALTGILMAYESAVGEELDSTKKEVATQELITTTTIADNIGQINATEIVNDTKIQVIQGNVIQENDIDVIINEVAEENQVTLSEEDRQLLLDLMMQISEQEYNYEDMQNTLERVESNLEELKSQSVGSDSVIQIEEGTGEYSADSAIEDTTDTQGETAETQTPQTETLAEDSILLNTDDSALGENVVFDATDQAALAETEPVASETQAAESTDSSSADFVITTTDTYTDGTDSSAETEPAVEITDATPETEPTADIVDATPETEPTADIVDAAPETESTVDIVDAAAPETEPAADIVDAAPETEPAAEEVIETEAATEAVTEAVAEAPAPVLSADDMVFAQETSEDTGYESYPAGLHTLDIYFQREDIAAGSGTLTVVNTSQGTVSETISLADTQHVSIEPMTSDELADMGWNAGSKAVISLDNGLDASSTYCISLSDSAFIALDDGALSEAVEETWYLETSEYGFVFDDDTIRAGETVTGRILMDGTDATYADIESADTSVVSFDPFEFTQSDSFTAVFASAGRTSFEVVFYDADGNYLDELTCTVDVQ